MYLSVKTNCTICNVINMILKYIKQRCLLFDIAEIASAAHSLVIKQANIFSLGALTQNRPANALWDGGEDVVEGRTL